MKKLLVYSLVTLGIIGIAGVNNNWEDKGTVTVRNADQKIEEIKNDKRAYQELSYSKDISIPQGGELIINLQNSFVNIKTHDLDSIIIENDINNDFINIKNNVDSVEVFTNSTIDSKFDSRVINILIPKNCNFNLKLIANDSKIDVEAQNLKNISIQGGSENIDLTASSTGSINVLGDKGNINFDIDSLNGNITGNTGIGSIIFEMENKELVNKNGFNFDGNSYIKTVENQDGKFNIKIEGDLGKVIFN